MVCKNGSDNNSADRQHALQPDSSNRKLKQTAAQPPNQPDGEKSRVPSLSGDNRSAARFQKQPAPLTTGQGRATIDVVVAAAVGAARPPRFPKSRPISTPPAHPDPSTPSKISLVALTRHRLVPPGARCTHQWHRRSLPLYPQQKKSSGLQHSSPVACLAPAQPEPKASSAGLANQQNAGVQLPAATWLAAPEAARAAGRRA